MKRFGAICRMQGSSYLSQLPAVPFAVDVAGRDANVCSTSSHFLKQTGRSRKCVFARPRPKQDVGICEQAVALGAFVTFSQRQLLKAKPYQDTRRVLVRPTYED